MDTTVCDAMNALLVRLNNVNLSEAEIQTIRNEVCNLYGDETVMTLEEQVEYFRLAYQVRFKLFLLTSSRYALPDHTLDLIGIMAILADKIIEHDDPFIKEDGKNYHNLISDLKARDFNPDYDDLTYDDVDWAHSDAWAAYASWDDWCFVKNKMNKA